MWVGCWVSCETLFSELNLHILFPDPFQQASRSLQAITATIQKCSRNNKMPKCCRVLCTVRAFTTFVYCSPPPPPRDYCGQWAMKAVGQAQPEPNADIAT